METDTDNLQNKMEIDKTLEFFFRFLGSFLLKREKVEVKFYKISLTGRET